MSTFEIFMSQKVIFCFNYKSNIPCHKTSLYHNFTYKYVQRYRNLIPLANARSNWQLQGMFPFFLKSTHIQVNDCFTLIVGNMMIHIVSLYLICYITFCTGLQIFYPVIWHYQRRLPTNPNKREYLCLRASGASELWKKIYIYYLVYNHENKIPFSLGYIYYAQYIQNAWSKFAWGPFFVGAPGQLPTLPSPKSGPVHKAYKKYFQSNLKHLFFQRPGGHFIKCLSLFVTDKFALSQSDARISVAYKICQWKTLTKHLMKCPPGMQQRAHMTFCISSHHWLLTIAAAK